MHWCIHPEWMCPVPRAVLVRADFPARHTAPSWAHSTLLAILEQRGKLKGGSLGWWAFLEASSRDLAMYRGQQWEELSFCTSWRWWLQGELERPGNSVSSSPNLGETCGQFLYLSSFLCLSSPGRI